MPTTFDPLATVTLVGGTVGGYITFAGGHRLLDAGIRGKAHLPEANRGAVTGILLTAIIRFALFLASLGVVAMGLQIDKDNPPASVFQLAAGDIGLQNFRRGNVVRGDNFCSWRGLHLRFIYQNIQ